MLAVSPIRCTNEEARQVEAQSTSFIDVDFDFTIDGSLLEDIDFGDIFQRFDPECLPGLEVDPAEILADFDSLDKEEATPADCREKNQILEESRNHAEENVDLIHIKDDDMACEAGDAKSSSSSSSVEAESKRRPGATTKSSQGKKKAKVMAVGCN